MFRLQKNTLTVLSGGHAFDAYWMHALTRPDRHALHTSTPCPSPPPLPAVIVAPLGACIPVVKDFMDVLHKGIELPYKWGCNCRGGHPVC